MTTRICLIVAVVLAGAATASAQADGPVMPAAPAPPFACKPSKNVVCGPVAPPALNAAIGSYQRTLDSPRVRRGLGLPSPRQLFGRAGAHAETLADGRLARASSAAPTATTARAAGAGGLQAVGSVGGVKVQATPAPGLGAGVDLVDYADRITGPHGTQTRSVRFTATAAACPIAATGTSNVGTDVGNFLAAEHIVTTQRSGHLEITTDFTIDTTGSREFWGTVNGNAALTGIDPKPDAFARILRVRRTRDLRTGRTYREKPLEERYEIASLYPLGMQAANGSFERLIQQYTNANSNDPADAVVPDRLLDEGAFEAAAQTFMLAVGAKAWDVYKQAEQQWRTPNRCVEAHGDAPDRLIPGQSVNVHVSATSKRGDPPQSLRAYAHFAPYVSAGLTVDPYAFVEPDANVAAAFTVTPPAQAWPDSDPERLRILFYSTGGIGEVDTDLRAQTLPINYRVLSASYSVRTKASQPGGICAGFGGTSGTLMFSGDSNGVTQDIDSTHTIDGNVLDGSSLSGPLHGGIFAKATMTVGEQFAGCKTDYTTQHLVSCSVSYGPTTLPGATTIGFHIQVPDPASGQANLQWQVNAPGAADASQDNCETSIQGYPPHDRTVQTAPLSQLLSTAPQTFTFTQSVHLDQDAFGKPASIDYDWTYTITVQRI
jgi:hypothetical protein